MNQSICFKLGALFAFLAVALGAFGAHGLKALLSEQSLATFETGVRYQFYHALGLFALGYLFSQKPYSITLKIAGYALSIGIMLFSGSLYLLACRELLGVPRWIGAITPRGGISFLVGWGAIFVDQFRRSAP